MQQINGLTQDPCQLMTMILQDPGYSWNGTSFTLEIQFVPMQYGWFITNLTYGSFVLNGVRICNLPNILHQWKNLIPFGLACFSMNDREPSQQQDFQSAASQLFVLSASEVEQYAEIIGGG